MLNRKQKILSLFETVRDIPYGYSDSRDPMNVLKNRKGTCSGKHLLLGHLYNAIGIKVQYIMCLTKFNFIEGELPFELKKMLKKNDIYDYHNYIRIFIKKWLDVDVTFDLPLKSYGFPVNYNWDCTSNCKIALKPIKIFHVKDLIKEKRKALSKLSKEIQISRQTFIKELSIWMESLRSK